MDECERCGRKAGWNATPMELIGGAKALLCPPCLTDWQAHISSTTEWQEGNVIKARLAALDGQATAGQPPSQEMWLDALQARDALHRRYFTISKRWLAQKVEHATAAL